VVSENKLKSNIAAVGEDDKENYSQLRALFTKSHIVKSHIVKTRHTGAIAHPAVPLAVLEEDAISVEYNGNDHFDFGVGDVHIGGGQRLC